MVLLPQKGIAINPKIQAVNLAKHCHGQVSYRPGKFSKIRCCETPKGRKNVHFNPVCKYIETLLSNSSLCSNKIPNSGLVNGNVMHKKITRRLCRKCECTLQKNVNCMYKDVKFKPSCIPSMGTIDNDQQNKIHTNLTNINNECNFRVSLQNSHNCCQQNMQYPDTPRSAPEQRIISNRKPFSNTHSDVYVDQLKNEIKQSRLKLGSPQTSSHNCCKLAIQESCSPNKYFNDEYLKKLKEELLCKRNKCMEEARHIIDDLKNEILDYRSQTTTKYSSCSDIAHWENEGAKSTPIVHGKCIEKKQITETPTTLGQKLNVESTRDTPCECLWKSKVQQKSSADMQSMFPMQCKNSDTRLEEVNDLLERVGTALKDLTKDRKSQLANNKEKIKSAILLSKSKNDCSLDCIKAVCSRGESQSQLTQEKSKSAEKRKEKEESIKRSVSKANSKEELKKNAVNINNLTPPVKSMRDVKEIYVKNKEKQSQKDVAEHKTVGKKVKITTERTTQCDSEIVKNSVTTIERASSPIDLQPNTIVPKTDTTENVPDVVMIPHKNSSTQTIEITETVVPSDRHHKAENEVTLQGCACYSTSSCTSDVRKVSDKLPNLKIQKMPPLNICNRLVIEKTLHLCIKPTGSIMNEICDNRNNIGYEEVAVDTENKVNPREITNDNIICKCSDENFEVIKIPIVTETPDEKIAEHYKKEQASKCLAGVLDKDALLLYRSFQILEGQYADAQPVSDFETSSKKSDVSSQSSSQSVSYKDKQSWKSPHELGFYKTQSIQCSLSQPKQDMYSDRDIEPGSLTATDDRKVVDNNSMTNINKTSDEHVSSSKHIENRSVENSDSLLEEIDFDKLPQKSSSSENMDEEPTKETFVNKKKKVDDATQVSFESSSDSELAEDSLNKDLDGQNAITSFIKGLTGTSEEKLGYYRSVPSLQKSDLDRLSRTVLQTMPEHTPNELRKTQFDKHRNVDIEDVDTIGYNQKKSNDENESELDPKKEKFKELRRLYSLRPDESRGDKKGGEETIMTITDCKDSIGRGDDKFVKLTKRASPFYRQILSQVIEPSVKRNMQKSGSDEYPINDSTSEGEIKCKSSLSVGEIVPCKLTDQMITPKNRVLSLKQNDSRKLRSVSDKSEKLANHRSQYNYWVTHYLLKHRNFEFNDSSTASGGSNSKM